MLVRLFKLGQRTRLLALGLGTLAWLASSAACGGKEFTANGTPSASGSSSGGAFAGGDTSAEAGESGSSEGGRPEGGSSGAPGAGRAGMTGSAGKPATGCDCSAGQYCQDGTSTCRNCIDFRRFEFGPAQKLSTLAQTAKTSERFARSAGAGSALFYVSGAADNSKIWYTAAPLSGLGSPVSGVGRVESGPLFVDGFQEQNLFFDRQQNGARKLMMALFTAPAALTKEAAMPAPFNESGSEDYGIAISPNTGNVYWMSNRNGEAELLWQPTSITPAPTPAVLALKVKAGTKECERSGEDATPWVNVAGTLLLFRNPSLDESCNENDSGATDLFAAPLNKDGVPTAAAISLDSLNTTGGTSWETDPSLSPDACTLYFASDSGTGDFDLYKAPRN